MTRDVSTVHGEHPGQAVRFAAMIGALRRNPTRVSPLPLAVALLACACPGEGTAPSSTAAATPHAATKATPDDAPRTGAPAADTKAAPKPPPAQGDTQPLGRALDGPLPVTGLLGKPPAEVEAQLSEPLGKGMVRNSCVRYLPERTWFECKFAMQRYGDKSGAYTAIGVEFQDGIATAIAFEGLEQATGPLDARAALGVVGLELPGEPKVRTEGDVVIHSWFNAAARLRIEGREYRVVVSSIADDWARTKVEVILNDPLDANERTRVIERPAADG